jgi:hypothetical protein
LPQKPFCVTVVSARMLRRIVLPVVAIAFALPGHATAGLASLSVRELPLHGERTLSTSGLLRPFQMVGIHWRGTGTLELRTRLGGRRDRPGRGRPGDGAPDEHRLVDAHLRDRR